MMESEHPNLAAALVAALAGLSLVEAGHKANAGTYSYEYASIADVVKVTRPVLAEHGLVALTPVKEHGTGLECTVVLLHQSGERMEFGPFPFPFGRDAQATGSLVTYHRRYALVSALGMGVGDDDDGAGARPAAPAVATPQVAFADPADADAAIAIIRNLSDEKRDLLDGWWGNNEFPRSPAGKPNPRLVDVEQIEDVLEFLRALDAQDVAGEGPEVSATPVDPSPPLTSVALSHTESYSYMDEAEKEAAGAPDEEGSGEESEAVALLDAAGLVHPGESTPVAGPSATQAALERSRAAVANARPRPGAKR